MYPEEPTLLKQLCKEMLVNRIFWSNFLYFVRYNLDLTLRFPSDTISGFWNYYCHQFHKHPANRRFAGMHQDSVYKSERKLQGTNNL